VLLGVRGGSSVSGSNQANGVGGGQLQLDEDQNEIVSTGGDKENNKQYNLQVSSNVEHSDGIRKEIP